MIRSKIRTSGQAESEVLAKIRSGSAIHHFSNPRILSIYCKSLQSIDPQTYLPSSYKYTTLNVQEKSNFEVSMQPTHFKGQVHLATFDVQMKYWFD